MQACPLASSIAHTWVAGTDVEAAGSEATWNETASGWSGSATHRRGPLDACGGAKQGSYTVEPGWAKHR